MDTTKLTVTRPDGRALPPRPTLLVGDEAACHAAWAKLRPVAQSLLASLPADRSTTQLQLLEEALTALNPAKAPNRPAGSTGAPATATLEAPSAALSQQVSSSGLQQALAAHRHTVTQLQSLLAPLRSLRESLVGNLMMQTDLARQVYECSCDVAAASGREAAPELLKSLQGLVTDVYPHMQQQSGGLIDTASALTLDTSNSSSSSSSSSRAIVDSSSGATGTRSSPPSAPAATEQPAQPSGAEAQAAGARVGEVQAGRVLFFHVAPARPGPVERGALLAAVARQPAVWHHPCVQWVLRVVRALSLGDWVAVGELRACLPCAHAATCAFCQQQQRSADARAQGPAQPPATARGCAPSRLLREVVDLSWGQVQQCALAACCAAYHKLPWAMACPLLVLSPGRSTVDMGPAAAGLRVLGGRRHGGATGRRAGPDPWDSDTDNELGEAPGAARTHVVDDNKNSRGSTGQERVGNAAVVHEDPDRRGENASGTDLVDKVAELAIGGIPSGGVGSVAVQGKECDHGPDRDQESGVLLGLCGLLWVGAGRGLKGAGAAWRGLQTLCDAQVDRGGQQDVFLTELVFR